MSVVPKLEKDGWLPIRDTTGIPQLCSVREIQEAAEAEAARLAEVAADERRAARCVLLRQVLTRHISSLHLRRTIRKQTLFPLN
eukprot:COSAG05_NODE_358_length_10812_cov_90.986372_7_plen_84_part_00